MSRLRSQIFITVAAEFLSRCFDPRETIAILLRRISPTVTVQRIVRLECALAPRYLGWLASENAFGVNVYVAANPLHTDSRKRTKESVAAVRHLYLDLDTDAHAKLAAIGSSETVPAPTAIVSTSSGKYQVLWRVDGFSLEQQESMLKLLAIAFGGDRACTDSNRVLRLPGFLNHKYDPAQPVTVEYLSYSTLHPGDFRVRIPDLEGELIRGPIEPESNPESRPESIRIPSRIGLGFCGNYPAEKIPSN